MRGQEGPLSQLLLLRRAAHPTWEARYHLNQLQALEMGLNRNRFSLRGFKRIFEFGCGHGRLTRLLCDLAPEAEIHGCDVSRREVARCAARCPRGQFIVNEIMPPLPYPEGRFDFIYSYSVFTHLSEENHRRWLKDLTRLLQPGGVMAHSTHSVRALEQMEFFSPERLAKYSLGGTAREFRATGKDYHYAVDHPELPEYGLAIISRRYIEQQWPGITGLKILDYLEDCFQAFPEGCQDLVILKKEI